MKRIVAMSVLFLLPALILGCNGPGRWNKDGASPSMTAADFADCNSFAQSASQKDTNINQDIMSARGRDWQNTGALDTIRDTYQAQNQDQSETIIFRCMVGKGYAPG